MRAEKLVGVDAEVGRSVTSIIESLSGAVFKEAPLENPVIQAVDYAPMPPMAIEPMPGNPDTSEGILVRLQESPEPQDGTQEATQDGTDNFGPGPAAADVIEAGP